MNRTGETTEPHHEPPTSRSTTRRRIERATMLLGGFGVLVRALALARAGGLFDRRHPAERRSPLATFAAGLAVGAGAAALFAPWSGKQAREHLLRTLADLRGNKEIRTSEVGADARRAGAVNETPVPT